MSASSSSFANAKMLIPLLLIGFLAYTWVNKGSTTDTTASNNVQESIDLGQVLDRSGFAMEQFSEQAQSQNISELQDQDLDKLADYMSQTMNANPRFYDKPIGIALQKDASFLGFNDSNQNGIKDQGESGIFNLAIDGENERFIATNTSGASVHQSFGSSMLTGFLLGSLLSRQRSAGVAAGSFNNKPSTARSAYASPSRSSRPTSSARSSSRSGGLSGGK